MGDASDSTTCSLPRTGRGAPRAFGYCDRLLRDARSGRVPHSPAPGGTGPRAGSARHRTDVCRVSAFLPAQPSSTPPHRDQAAGRRLAGSFPSCRTTYPAHV
ncbi:hypothetical protein KNE206_66930 [Kitasatospora sp. NE20-6]